MERDFWDYPELISALKADMHPGDGLLIVLPEIEPIEYTVQGSSEPPIIYRFPQFEFRHPLKLRHEPGEIFVQAGPMIDRVRYYLLLCVGEGVPVGAWAMSHTSHAPVHRGGQPVFAWLSFRDRTPEEVYETFLRTYQTVEDLLQKIDVGSPLDLVIRSYGDSLHASEWRASLVGLWKTLEVFGREYGPKNVPLKEGRRTYSFLQSVGLAPDARTFDAWRKLRNSIAHGSIRDEQEREIHETQKAMLELAKNAILQRIDAQVGIRIEPIFQQMIRPKKGNQPSIPRTSEQGARPS